MDHDHVVHIDLEKEECGRAALNFRSSPTPSRSHHQRTHPPLSSRSCLVCRKTLLLSYFNCCAVCLGVIECGRALKANKPKPTSADSLPIAHSLSPPPPARVKQDSSSSSSSSSSCCCCSSCSSQQTTINGEDDANDGAEHKKLVRGSHCDSGYCRYTHRRPLMLFFALCELVPALGGLAFLNVALYRHEWALLRFAGILLLQWWQVFILPRQWHCKQSIVTGQLIACIFMVWFYVEGSRCWRW
ncbi:hypothetical protein GGR54DRAFT_474531 [Hypoxylon sp. NC1633]|nr:hypothetical protein GGR54DRAFT_474531 [Hypoxylon sp. NC1633]